MTSVRQHFRNIARIRQILQVAARHGFFRTIKRMGLGNLVTLTNVKIKGSGPDAVRMRKMLEELGPTFVKMGQVLSMRPDLVPREYIDEFSKLYDRADPFPFEDVKRVIEHELGKPLSKVFREFEAVPMAAASIGQVHGATLHDGTRVVVKVQRPGIRQTIKTDMEILNRLAKIAEDNIAAFKNIRAVEIVGELDRMLEREMDYRQELANAQRIYANFQGDERVCIPKSFPAITTRKVLVLERITGTMPLRKHVEEKGWDAKAVAELLANTMFEQYFIHGFFHADPSPGNLLVLGPNRIAYLDFGAMGDIPESRRQLLMDMLAGFAVRDSESVTDALLDLGEAASELKRDDLVRSIRELMDYYFTKGATVYDVELADKVMAVSRRHGVVLPADFTLLVRSLFQTEMTARRLDPDFNLLASAKPAIKKIAAQRLDPRAQVAELLKVARNYRVLFRDFPKRMDRILTKAESGELTIKMDIKGTSLLEKKMDRMVARIETSLFFAALLIILTMIFTFTDRLGTKGYIVCLGAIIMIWLLTMFVRSRD